MTELDLIIDLHLNSERQGPGSDEETLKALSFINLPKNESLKIADIGCGSGGQTITLAKELNAEITAVDLFPAFLEELNEKALKEKVDTPITTREASMEDLPFKEEEFDLIWSEGAIYNIGFERGVREWNKFIKPGGYMAVSEITWITNNRPEEIESFWTTAYPEIGRASDKMKILEENGYTVVGYFYLSEDSWLKNYYEPLRSRFNAFLERNNNAELAQKVVKENNDEIELYKKFKDYFSYGFYVAKKI